MICTSYKRSVSSSKCHGRLKGRTIVFSACAWAVSSVKWQPAPEDDHLLIRRQG